MGVAIAPVNGTGAGARLLDAGAEELYLGFYDPAWETRFPGSDLNRMSGFGPEANRLDFAGLLAEAASLQARPVPPRGLLCVFNALDYTSAQLDFIARAYLPYLAAAGFTGVILSDPALAFDAHANGLEAHLSTMGATYNAELARWYRDQGIDRVVLPRDLGSREVSAIAAAVPGLSWEVFLMRNGCPFADATCMGLHRAGRPSLCRSVRAAERTFEPARFGGGAAADLGAAAGLVENPGPLDEAAELWAGRFHLNTCGLCALWRFEQAGVDAYKIVGRGDDVDSLADDVALVARNLEIARSCPDEASYLAAMERPAGLLELCANEGLSCYYPEVRASRG
jgi:putative protease